MALVTSTVSGYLTKPDGTALVDGAAVFTLSGPASSGEYITSSVEVIARTDSQGYFSVELMPNSSYPYFTYYNLVGYDLLNEFGKRGNGYPFGKISVPVLDSDISDLIPIYRSTSNTYYLHQGDSMDVGVTMLDALDKPVDISDSNVSAWLELGSSRISVSSAKSSTSLGLIEISVSPSTSSYLVKADYNLVIELSLGQRVKTLRSKVKVI